MGNESSHRSESVNQSITTTPLNSAEETVINTAVNQARETMSDFSTVVLTADGAFMGIVETVAGEIEAKIEQLESSMDTQEKDGNNVNKNEGDKIMENLSKKMSNCSLLSGENTEENDDDRDREAELVRLLFDREEKEQEKQMIKLDQEEKEDNKLEKCTLPPRQQTLDEAVDKNQIPEKEQEDEDNLCLSYRSNNTENYDQDDGDDDDVECIEIIEELDFGNDDKASETFNFYSSREVHNGKVIGEGGFGRVLKGNLHGGSGVQVAIKLFHAPLVITSELHQILMVKHKNVVSVFGIVHQVDEVDCPQLVLQYFPEGNILQFLSRHENPEDNSSLGKIALDIVEGFQYLQERNIVHGNLAARNVLVEKIIGRYKTYYNAKISDIGLIRFAEASGGNYMKLQWNNKVVPVRWVPKEIIEEDGSPDFTFSSDVWSFGVVLWEMWTRGAIPYGASYSNLRVVQFLKDGYSPLKVHRPTECPPKVVAVMESIFQVNPSQRPTFNEIHVHFRKYKGYGKDNGKPKMGGAVARSSRGTPPGDEDCKESSQNSKLDEKLPKKKRNNKKAKKLFNQDNKPSAGADHNLPRPMPQNATPGSADGISEVGGACAVPKPPKWENQRPKNKSQNNNDTDSTIAALLKRVNQLEKEKRGGARGGGRGRGDPWPKRSGAPRFSRGIGRGGRYDEQDEEYNRPRSGSSMVQRRSESSPPPPPPVSSQAPPPYTEEPLPHHASSRFSAPLPEYEYGASASGRGINSRGYPSGHRGRAVAVERVPRSPVGGEEDFVRKIKRLAEEIEFLRAEKMTQELLKKSAELADIMKVVTAGDRISENRDSSTLEPRYAASGGGVQAMRSLSPRQIGATSRGGDDYYANEYEDYEYNNLVGGGGRWSRDDHHNAHPHFNARSSGGQRERGSHHLPQQRRPYYKGRGGQRGNYSGDRYSDGPYGN